MRPFFILASCFFLTLPLALVSTGCASRKDTAATTTERAATPESSDKPADPPQVQAPAQDARPVIVTFGDSLTQGVEGKSYPAFLQDLLDEQGYRYRVDNQGVSGDTSTDGLARITLPPNYGPDYVKPFTAIYPDLAKKYKVRLMPFLLVHVFNKPDLMRS